jgi:hypothetical protein
MPYIRRKTATKLLYGGILMSYVLKGYTVPEGVFGYDDVKAFQRGLNSAGASLKVDGVWDSKTEVAFGEKPAADIPIADPMIISRFPGRGGAKFEQLVYLVHQKLRMDGQVVAFHPSTERVQFRNIVNVHKTPSGKEKLRSKETSKGSE